MIKEELKQEAEKYANNILKDVNCTLGNTRARHINSLDVEEAYLASAEPRERRIAELEAQVTRAFEVLEDKRKKIKVLGERCLQLQKDKGNLTDKVKELEQQLNNWQAKADYLSGRGKANATEQ